LATEHQRKRGTATMGEHLVPELHSPRGIQRKKEGGRKGEVRSEP